MLKKLLARLFRFRRRSDQPDEGPRIDHAPREGKVAAEALADPMDALAIELGRARRYEHALSIVVARPRSIVAHGEADPESNGADPHENGRGRRARAHASHADGQEHRAAEAEAISLARRLGLPPEQALACLTAAGLREGLRTSDVVCYDPAGEQFVLGLMETDAPTARRAVTRMRALFRERLSVDLAAGVAQFPADGLTLEDLVQTARAEADGSVRNVGDERLNGHARGRYRIRSDGMGRPGSRRSARREADPTPVDSRMVGGE